MVDHALANQREESETSSASQIQMEYADRPAGRALVNLNDPEHPRIIPEAKYNNFKFQNKLNRLFFFF